MRKLNTWPETIGRGIFVGAAVGAFCVAAVFFLVFCVSAFFDQNSAAGGVTNGIGAGAFMVLVSFLYAFFIWLVGIVFLGLGPWWLLHQLGLRNRLTAAGLGFAMPVLLCTLVAGRSGIMFGAALGAVGILVAEAIWYSSYKYGAGAADVGAPSQNISGA